jgi:hypothetical protein
MKAKLATLLVAAMLVLAGCAGTTGSPTPSGADSAQTAQVNFYVSDDPGAIDDFSHLNVTITQVAFVSAEDDEANETEAEMEDEETEMESDEENETEADDENETEMDEAGDRVVRDVNDTTVDLTQLKGTNASLVDSFDVPSGNYSQVVLYIDGINATLTDGTSQDVKLPSGMLRLNQDFTLSANSSVDFVYDFTVVKAGNSGKYIFQPVVSASGVDQEIDRIDDDDEDEREGESEASLDVAFAGTVTAGENATLEVSADGEAAANATVVVEQYGPDGETLAEETYTTDANGQVTVDVATNATELEVEAETEADAEGELELEL